MGRFISKQLCQALLAAAGSSSYVYCNALSSASKRTISTATGLCNILTNSSNSSSLSKGLLASPWSVFQQRGSKVLGSEVRPGNVIHRKGRVYQVLKAQHTQHGRGGASIQVELRDVDGGNKVTEKFRTDEAIERVYVEEKSFTYLYTEGDTVVLMDSDSYEQVEVPKELFGKSAVYLKDDMKVTVQYYDERLMSASVPQRVTCTVMEAQTPMKGLSATQQYKRVVLDNGLTVLAPPFIVIGDAIVINTADDSYMTRISLPPPGEKVSATCVLWNYIQYMTAWLQRKAKGTQYGHISIASGICCFILVSTVIGQKNDASILLAVLQLRIVEHLLRWHVYWWLFLKAWCSSCTPWDGKYRVRPNRITRGKKKGQPIFLSKSPDAMFDAWARPSLTTNDGSVKSSKRPSISLSGV
ncbi:Elongation factor P-like protein [Drosera capensis]